MRVLFLFLVLFSNYMFSQNEDINWVFGVQAGLSFSTNPPSSISGTRLNSFEACSSISDSNGNLLFYTDGVTVFNANHQIMINGDNLLGDTSTSQNLILPNPQNDFEYYLFYVDDVQGLNGFNFALVSFEFIPLGEVLLKNQKITSNITERMTWAYSRSQTEYYIIVSDNNSYFTYKLHSNGLTLNPIISTPPNRNIGTTQSHLKYNAQTDLLASGATDFIEIMRLDRNTGELSDFLIIDIPNSFISNQIYSVEFSKSGNYLYANTVSEGILRFDISSYDKTQIENSVQSILPINPIQQSSQGSSLDWGLQIGPDDKIYVVHSGHNRVGVIENPDSISLPNYTINSIDVNGLTGIAFPQNPPTSEFNTIYTKFHCLGDFTQFTFQSDRFIESYVWELGDGTVINDLSPSHQYTNPGVYDIRLTVTERNGLITVFTASVEIFDTPATILDQRVSFCGIGSFSTEEFFGFLDINIDRSINEISLYSNQNDANLFLNPLEEVNLIPGVFELFIRVSVLGNDRCYQIKSIEVTVDNNINLEELNLCGNDFITLLPNASDFYLWQDGSTTSFYEVNSIGDYYVWTRNQQCYQKLQYQVSDTNALENIQVIVQDLSDNNYILVTNPVTPNITYSLNSQGFQTDPKFENLNYGEYKLSITDISCGYSREILINIMDYPKFFTPNSDGFHDFWQLKNGNKDEIQAIFIYDRFGKLLKQLDPESKGWDGTFNGENLPSSDYWFKIKRSGKADSHGHFSLIR